MNRSQSWKKIPSEEAAEFKEGKRATSHPNLSHSASLGNAELRTSRASVEDLRRKIVRLNKELDAEKAFVKQLRREKSIDLKHAREEEQRRAASMQTDLKTKLHKEKTNELTALREQMHKDKEKEILQIIRQKDDSMKMAQQNWLKEKEELRAKLRAELFSDAKEESKKEFDRERTRLEQEILDLKMQKKEMEEALKILQESDKRKADEIRRIFHEHEIELEKFKRNSWQESRRQMGEIRQLLNIIEQLERKLGIDSGHINKLRMEKESLYDELRRKTNTFDAWDSMMSSSSSSSSAKNDSDTSGATFPSPNTDPKYSGVSNEIRTLQRKNTELSSLVKKLDEKNQQLATKNAELLSELERSDKEARDKSKKLEKKNFELTQSAKKLESKNKALQDEINTHKRKPASYSSSKDAGGKMDKSVRVRGQTSQADSTDVISLKQQVKDQCKTIEELKQNLMEKERRIDLLKERKKSGKKAKSGRTSVDAVLHQEHDDAVSSDISDISEMSSNDSNSDANKLKKLAKELLALERAYALLQAQVGSTVDVERDELERQQLQSDLIESQARIHELERMMDSSVQGAGVEELQQLQHDNKILYQKLIAAENERDRAQNELLKNSEDLRDLQDKKDLLEFELEEMSQLSFAGSEDEFVSPRKTREKEDRKLPLSLEEVKAYLEEMENEKTNVLSVMELEALKQARISLTAMPQKISHLEATEAVLRSKVKDLEERNILENQRPVLRQYDSHMGEQETLSEVLELERTNRNEDDDGEQIDSARNKSNFTLLDIDDHFKRRQLLDKECLTGLTNTVLCDMEHVYEKFKFLRDNQKEDSDVCEKATNTVAEDGKEKNDVESMTEFIWEDIVEIEETYRDLLSNIEGLVLDGKLEKVSVKMIDKRISTDLLCEDISALEYKGKELDELQETIMKKNDTEKQDQESSTDTIQFHEKGSNTEVIEKHEIECNTDLTWDAILREEENNKAMVQRIGELEKELSKIVLKRNNVEVMTDLVWKDVSKQEELYKEQIEELQDLLLMEQEQRTADEMKLLEYEVLKEANMAKVSEDKGIMTEDVWVDDPAKGLEKLVQTIVEKSKNEAVAEVSSEIIFDLERCLMDRLSICQINQETQTNVTSKYLENLEESNKDNIMELARLRGVIEEKERRIEELHNELSGALVGNKELQVMMDCIWKEVSDREELYNKQIEQLQEKLSGEQEMRQADRIKLVEYEVLKEASISQQNEDKSVMTDVVWIQETGEVLERTVQEIIEKTENEAMFEVASDVIYDLVTRSVLLKFDKQTLTDILEENIQELENNNNKSNIGELVKMRSVIEQNEVRLGELENELSKVFSENNELEVMIDISRKDACKRDQLHKEQMEKLQAQLLLAEEMREADKIKLMEHEVLKEEKVTIEDKSVMTEMVQIHKLTDVLEMLIQEVVEEAKNEAVAEIANEDLADITQNDFSELARLTNVIQDNEQKLNELEIELTRSNIEKDKLQTNNDYLNEQVLKREQQFKDQIEEMNVELAKMRDVMEQKEQRVKEVEGELTKSLVDKKDVCIMTDLVGEDIDDLENKYKTKQDECLRQSCENGNMTDMTWVQVLEVEEKYEGFRYNIQEIQKKLAKVDVETEEVEIMTDLVWEDLSSKEQLYKEQTEEIQEQLITERELKEGMQEKLATADVEKNEVETMTDLVWEDMSNKEQLYKNKVEELQQQLIMEQVMGEADKMKLKEYETLKNATRTPMNEEECVMSGRVWVEETTEVLEENVQDIVEKVKNEAIKEVSIEVIEDLVSRLATHKIDMHTQTDITYKDFENLENNIQNIFVDFEKLKDVVDQKEQRVKELEEELSKRSIEQREIYVMTDLVGEDIDDLENRFKQEDVECLRQTCEKDMLTDMSWIEVLEVEEKYEEFRNNILEIQEKLAKVDVEKDEVETMTDLVWEDLYNQEQLYKDQIEEMQEQLIMERELREEMEGKLAKLDVKKDEVEIMTDLVWEDLCNQEQLYKEQIREMQDQLILEQVMREGDKMKLLEYKALRESSMATKGEDKSVMTDKICIEEPEEILEKAVLKIVLQAKNEAIAELANEVLFEVVKQDKDVMTEFSWKEIEYLEKTYREWVEELRQMKEELKRKQLERKDKSCTTEFQRNSMTDVGSMTDLEWNEIVHLENSYRRQVQQLQEIKNIKEKGNSDEEKSTMTEMKWEDIIYLETSYTQKLEELEIIAESIKDDERLEEKAVADEEAMTDLSWQDVVHLETSYREELEKLEIFAEELNERERDVKDEEAMTELKWDEVECRLESYKEQIEHQNALLERGRYHNNDHGGKLLAETEMSGLETESIYLFIYLPIFNQE